MAKQDRIEGTFEVSRANGRTRATVAVKPGKGKTAKGSRAAVRQLLEAWKTLEVVGFGPDGEMIRGTF